METCKINHLKFQQRLVSAPAFARAAANKALNNLRYEEADVMRLEPFIFWQLVRSADVKPSRKGFHDFFIIENNSTFIKIQTLSK